MNGFIAGVQPLAAGDRALLFLQPRNDGAWGVTQLIFGAFRRVAVGGHTYAVRRLDTAQELRRDGDGALRPLTASSDLPRDWARFVNWVANRAAGRESAPSYFRPARSDLRNRGEAFTLLGEGSPGCNDGTHNLRWFDFPGSVAIAQLFRPAGPRGRGFSEIQAALAAWTADPTSNVSYVYGGTNSVSAACQNTIYFDGDCLQPFRGRQVDPCADDRGAGHLTLLGLGVHGAKNSTIANVSGVRLVLPVLTDGLSQLTNVNAKRLAWPTLIFRVHSPDSPNTYSGISHA